MKNVLSKLLFLLFIVVFAIFIYRFNASPILVKTSANSTVVEKEMHQQDVNTMDKEQLSKVVHEYLTQNPEVLYSALEELQKRTVDDQAKKSGEFIKENAADILSSGEPPFLGSANADIRVVLFYDYNCSYCKQAHANIKKVLETDKKVKFILRPLPILGDNSLYAAKISLALHKISPEHFEAMHDQMMNMKPVSEMAVKQMVESFGIDYKSVENEMNSFAVKELITKNYELAKNIGIKGAPSQVIEGTFVPGFLESDKYEYIFKTIRDSRNTQAEQGVEQGNTKNENASEKNDSDTSDKNLNSVDGNNASTEENSKKEDNESSEAK